jgi:hypothetical protein
MAWKLYRWTWQLKSPLHIGFSPADSLSRTRLYIPARAMWAALTEQIARRKQHNSFPKYQRIGRLLGEKMRFTYLYPAEEVGIRWLTWLPRFENKQGLYWHREDEAVMSHPLFRTRLLSARPSTAIKPGTGNAEDGTLHEMECIQPLWRHHPQASVAFVGYIFLNDRLDHPTENELHAIRELYVGGETRYGFGHLVLLPNSPQHLWERAQDCFGAHVELDQNDPVIKKPSYLFAHATQDKNAVYGGAWELLAQWDWGMLRSFASLFWAPGSRSRKDSQFVISDSGLWGAKSYEGGARG